VKHLLILLSLLLLSSPLFGEEIGVFFSFENGYSEEGDDDREYVGEFKDRKPNGQGTLTLSDGTKYVGEYKDGEFNGQGTKTGKDGKKYDGEWKNNKPWNGILYDKSGKMTSKYFNGVKQ